MNNIMPFVAATLAAIGVGIAYMATAPITINTAVGLGALTTATFFLVLIAGWR